MIENPVTVFDSADDLPESELRRHQKEIQNMSYLEADLFIQRIETLLNVRMAVDNALFQERKRAGQVYMLQEDMKHEILKRVKGLGDATETAELQRVMN